jgi:predicted 3-demethylubiquinone-9 3-methyltransferase (glyoxalase superfamily)
MPQQPTQPTRTPKVTTFLWFQGDVEGAVEFYRSVFPEAQVVGTMPGGPDGSLMGATLEIGGQRFTIFAGGPHLTLNPAVSLYVHVETQAEVDEYWTKLLAGGGRESHCGWLVDRFGLSWQIVPSILPRLLADPDRERAHRATQAMLGMHKIDVAALERAAAGEAA